MATTVNAAFMVLVGGGRVWWVVVMGTEMAMAMRMETGTEGKRAGEDVVMYAGEGSGTNEVSTRVLKCN